MFWGSFTTYQLRSGYARVICMYISASKRWICFIKEITTTLLLFSNLIGSTIAICNLKPRKKSVEHLKYCENLSAGYPPAKACIYSFLFQTTFIRSKLLRSVETRGGGSFESWVTTFTLQYQQINILNPNGDRTFTGNSDSNTIVKNDFYNPIVTSDITLLVETSSGSSTSLRWALIGCNGGKITVTICNRRLPCRIESSGPRGYESLIYVPL